MILRVFGNGRNVRPDQGKWMDINDDGHMADLANVKSETMIHSFRWSDGVQAYVFTDIKRRLNGIKIRRLDINLWKLGTNSAESDSTVG